MVSTPVKNHATSNQPALPIWRDMSAETMKIPEPIITPTTTITESKRPRPRAKVGSDGEAGGVATCALVVINSLVILIMPEIAADLRERIALRRQISTWR